MPAQGRCEIQPLGSFLGDAGVKLVRRQAFALGNFGDSYPCQIVEAEACATAIDHALANDELAILFVEAFEIVIPRGLVRIVFGGHSARLPRFRKVVKSHI